MTTDRRAAVSNARRCVVLVALAIAAPVRAQPGPPGSQTKVGVVVDVDANPRCATTGGLAKRVRARSERIQFEPDSADVPRVRVTLDGGAPEQRPRHAALFIQWPDGRRAERHLRAGSCASALDALALLLVMTLDDQAGETETSAPEPGSREAAGTPGGDHAVVAQNSEPSRDDDPPSSHAVESHEAPVRPFRIGHGSVGASANLVGGPAPSVMPGFGMRAQLVFAGVRVWTPALGLGISHVWTHEVAEPGGDASFNLTGATLDVCPLGVQLEPFTAHACASAAIGRLHARGENSFMPQAHTEPWASVGGALRLSLALRRGVELQGGFALAAPIVRYGFAFQPDIFYRVPVVASSGHLGLGVRFP